MVPDLFYMVSQKSLKNDANVSDPSTKKGIFADLFFEDDVRDQGIRLTGIIVDKYSVLPIYAEVHHLAQNQKVYMLSYMLVCRGR
jgi:hypothetical protein